MTAGSDAALLDTNLVVYAYDPADAGKQRRAQAMVKRLSDGRGAVSTQILGEFFWTVTRKLQPPLSIDDAETVVQGFLQYWPVYDVTGPIVGEAIRGVQRFQLPYWDALIWATAKLNQVPLVLSEDFGDGAVLEGVRFLNPFAARFDLQLL